ncbi:DMT family transporter [Devosia sp.]|uniref:DMT family transporter n=1 Tax=Devosia sp. TaxID=1871048 RepID=UPI003A94B7C0
MIAAIGFAACAGVLVGVSRQVNGRLSVSTSPLVASLWNHVVGFAALTLLGLIIGGLIPAGAGDAPLYDYIGGPIGVVFVAAGSWLIPRIGAAQTAILIIAGQMVSSVLMDMVFAPNNGNVPLILIGVGLIIGGMVVAQRR